MLAASKSSPKVWHFQQNGQGAMYEMCAILVDLWAQHFSNVYYMWDLCGQASHAWEMIKLIVEKTYVRSSFPNRNKKKTKNHITTCSLGSLLRNTKIVRFEMEDTQLCSIQHENDQEALVFIASMPLWSSFRTFSQEVLKYSHRPGLAGLGGLGLCELCAFALLLLDCCHIKACPFSHLMLWKKRVFLLRSSGFQPPRQFWSNVPHLCGVANGVDVSARD